MTGKSGWIAAGIGGMAAAAVVGQMIIISGPARPLRANIVHAASCSRADVVTAINAASNGWTVQVPAGACEWDSQLTVAKGITLAGAGASNTTITSTYAGSWLISYTPADFSLNQPFRITGFTFDFNDTSGGIILNYSSSNLTIQTRIRIDHNVFLNATTQALMINGYRGVVDNNTFTGTDYPVRFASGDSEDWWNNWEGLVFGKADNNMYVEDNVFEVDEIVADCQFGNRYVFRYNQITSLNATGSYPLFDMHGNTAQYWSCFGGELYGNAITVQGDGGQILDQRGGRTAVFYNQVTGRNTGIKLREEVCDEDHPDTNSQAQHISDTYNWANWKSLPSAAIMVGFISQNACVGYQIAANQDFWNFSTTYDGSTPGTGCGSSLPAVCTVGDGFWLTDQSCSDLSTHVGVAPADPIDGTLYRCESTNSWASYFTPLTYPHPMRGGL